MIDYINDSQAIVGDDKVAYTFAAVSDSPRDFDSFRRPGDTLDWNNQANYFGDYLIMPFGANNDLPDYIREVVYQNYIAPGLINRKVELLWGMGPRLYVEKIVGNRITRQWVEVDEILTWLHSFDFETYLMNLAVDYHNVQTVASRLILNKGYKFGKGRINRPEHVKIDRVRLAVHKSDLTRTNITHAIVTDWSFKNIGSINLAKIYPLFDYKDPFKHPHSIHFSNKYTFCTDYYAIPEIYGSCEWIKQSTAVPLIFKALSKNSINLKYHVESPQLFWNNKEEEIKRRCIQTGKVFHESMLVQFRDEFLKSVTKVLAGIENTGKFLHTIKNFTVNGTNLIEQGWTIKIIDQNIKDFVEAQIKISQRSDRAVSAGINLHSALGNLSDTGKEESGSEQHYA